MADPIPSLTEAQAAVVAARRALADAKARAAVPPGVDIWSEDSGVAVEFRPR
ncbi:MAG: hypothetical protein WCP53_15395 [Verrucomicrobiota bacterium]